MGVFIEGRVLWGRGRVRAWWATIQSRLNADDQPAGVFEYAFAIAMMVVAVIAGLLLVLTQLRGR